MGRRLAAVTEGRIEAAIAVVAGKREISAASERSRFARGDDLPVPLDRNREYSRDCIETTAELGGHLAAVTEARVQAAIDVVAGEGEFRGGCPAERLGETGGDHLPVTLYRDGGGPAGAEPELGARVESRS